MQNSPRKPLIFRGGREGRGGERGWRGVNVRVESRKISILLLVVSEGIRVCNLTDRNGARLSHRF